MRGGTLAAARDVAARSAAVEMLSRWRAVLGLVLLMGCLVLSDAVLGMWAPAFLVRLHGSTDMRTTVELLTHRTLWGGCAGLCCGELLSDLWLRSGVAEAPVRVGLVGLLGALVTVVPAMLIASQALALGLLGAALFFLALPVGSSYASIQMIFPARVRGVVSASMLLLVSLPGAVGPALVGALSDVLNERYPMGRGLGVSIAVVAAGACLVGALASLFTIRPFRRDLAALSSAQPSAVASESADPPLTA